VDDMLEPPDFFRLEAFDGVFLPPLDDMLRKLDPGSGLGVENMRDLKPNAPRCGVVLVARDVEDCC